MEDSAKSTFNEKISTLSDKLGLPGGILTDIVDGEPPPELEGEDNVLDDGTGIELTIPDNINEDSHNDGKCRWLVVLAVFICLGCIRLSIDLREPTLKQFADIKFKKKISSGSKSPGLEETGCGETLLGTGTPCPIPDYSQYPKLSALILRLQQGDLSIVSNLTDILIALNKTNEIEPLLQKIFEESQSGRRSNSINSGEELKQDTNVNIYESEQKHITNTYEAVYSIFGIFSASLIMLLNCRWVSVLGSILAGLGLLGAAYETSSNVHLVSFLYGVLPGIGYNMVTVSTTVAIIAHFRKRRLLALLIPQIGEQLSGIITSLLNAGFIAALGISSWKSYLLFQASAALLLMVASLFIIPLGLKSNKPNGTLVSRIVGFNGLLIYKSAFLYTFALVFFAWYGGYAIIESKLGNFKGLDLIPIFSFGQVLVLLLLVGAIIGSCISCCIPRRIRLRTVTVILSAFAVTVSLFNFLSSQLSNFIYAFAYSGVIGVIQGMADPLLQYSIPLVVGEDNVAIGTGVAVTAQSIGALTMGLIADVIEQAQGKPDGCFYLSGILVLTSGVCASITLFVWKRKNCNSVDITPRGKNMATTT